MTEFTPLASLVGGLLIGISATVLLCFNGRVSGISGILGAMVRPERDKAWRLAFLGGLLLGGVVLLIAQPGAIAFDLHRSMPMLVLGGLLVGYGTQLGNGCTSGHGVCGVSRGSGRSLVATLTFMAVGMATVAVFRAVFGGVG